MILRNSGIVFLVCAFALPLQAESRKDQFMEASKTLVFVEYYIQREVDRQTAEGVGLVVSDDGLVICLQNTFPEWVPPDWFRDVQVYPANNPLGEGISATYLGQDWVNGWHYLRINDMETAAPYLKPITTYDSGKAQIGDTIWGVCMTPGDLDYIAYYREGKLSTVQPLPLDTAFVTAEVAVPGGPVFLEDGRFAGWAGRSLPMERDMWIGSEFFRANIRNPDETHMYLLAEPFLADLSKRIPETPLYHERPWIGIAGMQPLDKETARFMGLTNKGVVIVSEVLPESPADQGGLQDGDLVVAINGKPLPRLKPDSVLQAYFERELLLSTVGEPIGVSVLRGDESLDLEVIPAKSPTRMKEADRKYFEDIGVTLREYIVMDSIQRREDYRLLRGAVVNFIRPNSPAAAGELQPGDWVQEIDGQPIGDFSEAVERMQAALDNEDADEIVLLVRRSNETSVLRIRKQ
jgi:serine protease Do